ncbi:MULTISPECIES: gliding motility lipoprotein GldB [unclassified Saccharicrinis]|uniref:gliding motility lipoprotein GldB n=1 Tax=unclassified Saccharicrinis TaxID=2646859 RepID=UPI003D33FCFC
MCTFANKFVLLFCIVLGVTFFSCKDKNMYPDVSDIGIDINVIPIYQDIHGMDTMKVGEEIAPVIAKYPEFMTAYSYKIAKLGNPEAQEYADRLYGFVTYPANKDIYRKSKEIFPDFNDFQKQLEKGFKYYKYYFPEMPVPDVYLMISGFSQSIAVDSAWVGVSIEKYLGQDCEFYAWLGIPKYLRKGMVKEKMAPDVLRAIAMTNYSNAREVDDLINNMVYQGKVRYFVHRMFPDIQDTLLFDYSKEQMHWCNNHESDMWASLVEWKHLFKEDRMLIQKYTGDAPFTSNFGNNSAPRAGEFLGYKIIASYMNKNKTVSLKDLMEETDGRKILAASNYRP